MTFPGWIDRIGSYEVEKWEGRRPGGQDYLTLAPSTRRVIWHTTEGSSFEGAIATLRDNFSCSTLVIGPRRIGQMRPCWAQAATVRGDNSVAWQVEVVGFSKTSPWIFDEATLDPVLETLAWFKGELGVPLDRPNGWLDDCSDIEGIWATESNSRRQSGRAPTFDGHLMHLEWPANTHWDQGAVRWSRLLELAEERMQDPRLDLFIEGIRARRSNVTKNPDWPALKRLGYEVVDDGVEFPRPDAHAHSTLEQALAGLLSRVEALENGSGGLSSGDLVKLVKA